MELIATLWFQKRTIPGEVGGVEAYQAQVQPISNRNSSPDQLHIYQPEYIVHARLKTSGSGSTYPVPFRTETSRTISASFMRHWLDLSPVSLPQPECSPPPHSRFPTHTEQA